MGSEWPAELGQKAVPAKCLKHASSATPARLEYSLTGHRRNHHRTATGVTRASSYSSLIPASLMTRRQRSSSARKYRSSASGGSPTVTSPSLTLSLLKASDWTAAAADRLSRSITSGGVPLGANSPYQLSAA